MPYLLTVRKVKPDPVAQAMARKRWKGKTKAEKLATSRHASEARSRKAAARRLTAATDPASTTINMNAGPDARNMVRADPERPISEAQIIVLLTAEPVGA